MADVDLTTGGVAGAMPSGPPVKMIRLHKRIDFSKTNRDADDVLQLFKVANCRVIGAAIHVATAEGGTATADLGDGDDVDGFIDGADLNATGLTGMDLVLNEAQPNTIIGYSDGGKTYGPTVDTIDLKVLNDMDTGVIDVMVDVISYAITEVG